jgi:ABC-type microcin C transport system permease subunit YejB
MTSSEEYDEIMKRYGLDRHITSAYLIALMKYLKYLQLFTNYFKPVAASFMGFV